MGVSESTLVTAVYVCLSVLPVCVRFLCIHYHLHWVCEHHTVEANEVLVVQGVHGVDLTDEVLQSVGLAEHVRLQTLHSHVQLETRTTISNVFMLLRLFPPTLSVLFLQQKHFLSNLHKLIIETV